jgi:hypothetical protein
MTGNIMKANLISIRFVPCVLLFSFLLWLAPRATAAEIPVAWWTFDATEGRREVVIGHHEIVPGVRGSAPLARSYRQPPALSTQSQGFQNDSRVTRAALFERKRITLILAHNFRIL